jgi:peptidoglycan/LPS O-acetylase OafA/YrhL
LQNLGFIAYAGLANDWLAPTWSLAVEEQFYLVAPLVIRKVRERLLLRVLLGVIVAAPLLRLWIRWHYGQEAQHAVYVLTPCRADSLAVGMLIAWFWRKPGFQEWIIAHWRMVVVAFAVLSAGMMVLIGAFSYFYLPVTQIVGHSWIALFFGAALTITLARPETVLVSWLRSRALRNWGRISYCVYLIHMAVLAGVHGLLGGRNGVTDWRTFVAPTLAIPVCYVLASLSWRFFEERMVRIGHRYTYRAERKTTPLVTAETVGRGVYETEGQI